MSAFNALMDGYVGAPDPGPVPYDDNGGSTRGAPMGPAPAAAPGVAAGLSAAADVQGMPPIFGAHNTPLHVAFLGLIALGVIILLRKLGFRFSIAGNLGLGRT